MTRRLSVIAALVGALGLVVAFVLWRVPADEFILAPDRAKPLAGKVEVEEARPAGDTSVYYVDVFVRRTSLLEQLFPFTKPDGSTVLPEQALLPPGTSEAERDRQAGRSDPALEEFRWLIEELRVSLFAQELKTPSPVSFKRLAKAWADVQRR